MEQKFLGEFIEKEERKEVLIYVDEKESRIGIVELLKQHGAIVKVKTLEVGDFILSERVAVERKTRSDFESSIVDGRLFKQAGELAGNFEKPMLIIEGENFEERVHRKALLGAITSLMLDYGIQLFFTKDLDGTAEMLFSIARREQLGKKVDVRLMGNKKAYSLPQQQQQIVECLPMVGPKLAKALLRRFKNVENVARASEQELMEVEKIGKKKARAIRKLLTSSFE